MEMIIPKEKRVHVYSVIENKIINDKQKQSYSKDFIVDVAEIAKKRNESLLNMSDSNNLSSFVYIHKNGSIETESNVSKPKYEFHLDYNKV